MRNGSDPLAWAEFERQYSELILRYCQRCGLQAADANDIHQIVMMNLSKWLPNFKYEPDKGKFRDYLGRVVRNAIFRYRRCLTDKRRALDNNEVCAEFPDPGSEQPDPHWEEEWLAHHYRLALTALRACHEQRTMLVFDRLMAGEPIDRIAEQFEMTTHAVHKIKQRLVQQAKELIEQQIREEDASDG